MRIARGELLEKKDEPELKSAPPKPLIANEAFDPRQPLASLPPLELARQVCIVYVYACACALVSLFVYESLIANEAFDPRQVSIVYVYACACSRVFVLFVSMSHSLCE